MSINCNILIFVSTTVYIVFKKFPPQHYFLYIIYIHLLNTKKIIFFVPKSKKKKLIYKIPFYNYFNSYYVYLLFFLLI